MINIAFIILLSMAPTAEGKVPAAPAGDPFEEFVASADDAAGTLAAGLAAIDFDSQEFQDSATAVAAMASWLRLTLSEHPP